MFSIRGFFLILLFFGSCNTAPLKRKIDQPESDRIRIVCTTAQVAALVTAVAGDKGDIFVLIRGESDPHSYQLVKGDDEKFRFAQIVFYSGLGLEHSPSILRLIEKSNKLSIGDSIRAKQPDSIIRFAGHPDPHIWMDVSLWKLPLHDISDALSALRPEFAEEFSNRAKAFEKQLDKLHDRIQTICHSIPEENRYLVTTHDAFNYFTRAYLSTNEELEANSWQFRCFAPEGLAPEAQISTQDVEKTVNHIIDCNVHWIFAESNISQDSINRVAEVLRRKGHEVRIAPDSLYADAMGGADSPGGTYEGMMLYNADLISKYLKRGAGDE